MLYSWGPQLLRTSTQSSSVDFLRREEETLEAANSREPKKNPSLQSLGSALTSSSSSPGTQKGRVAHLSLE